jgi:hypothetical protein
MLRKISLVIMTLLMFEEALVSVGMLISNDASGYGHDGNVAVSSANVGMLIFGLILTYVGLREGHLWVWKTLWVWPLFLTAEFLGYFVFTPTRGDGSWITGVFAILFAAALFGVKPKANPA